MTTPHAFLCHSSADKEIVARLARDLHENGVQAFYDDWCINPGDSLRRKIDDGLQSMTHFLAVLSPKSLVSEWVNTELDAALIQKIDRGCTLIPVLLDLSADAVPPLLRGLKWVRLDDNDAGLKELVDAIHGISKAPPVVTVPERFAPVLGDALGLSTNAQRVAKLLCEQSPDGHPATIIGYDEITEQAGLGSEDLELAVDELVGRGLIKDGNVHRAIVMPEWELFFQLDPVVHNWDPAADANAIAAEVVNASPGFVDIDRLAGHLSWTARRLNPACAYLADQDLVRSVKNNRGGPFYYSALRATATTKRFQRDHTQ